MPYRVLDYRSIWILGLASRALRPIFKVAAEVNEDIAELGAVVVVTVVVRRVRMPCAVRILRATREFAP